MKSEYIDNLILRLCKQPRTFEFISINLSGFDPVELLGVLNQLESKGKMVNNNGLWCIKKSNKLTLFNKTEDAKTSFFNEYIGFFGLFDKPHPLDFEWRNSTGSLAYLISQIQNINEVHEEVLLLGFPTLFASACIKDIPQKVTLIEKNKPIVKGLMQLNSNKERFQILEADIFKVNPKTIGKYYSVIMDPPWYSPHFYQFMWLAAKCVEVGGVIGISLPPINTRPDISKERIEWFSFCQKQGLCLENLYAQKLNYAMPFFEFNAFRAAGIKDILPFWRKGDFALFRKVDSDINERPILEEKQVEWVEKEIDSVRIRIRMDDTTSKEELNIINLIKGDILPNVTTRDKRRIEANIWTSGNRIFKVNDTNRFLQLLDDSNYKKYQTDESNLVSNFVDAITEIEKGEYNNYLNWLYHEMERQID